LWVAIATLLVTVVVSIIGLRPASVAYDTASQQLKDIGSWLKVRVVDFQYVRAGEDKPCGPRRFTGLIDTEGCFFIEVQNRLRDDAVNMKFDHKVEPEDWMSEWALKEGLTEQEGGFRLSGFTRQVFVLFRSIAADPQRYYCQKDNSLRLSVDIKWQDTKNVEYEMTRKFKADCIKTKTGEVKFKWTSRS
jgi:hypothetical protein